MLIPVIGIEVHVEPRTTSKMFCDCSAAHFQKEPNSQVCPVCLGLPGALPVPNQFALQQLIRLGKALGCTISKHSYFERKGYFYPDLPKGYQISQYRAPLCVGGKLAIGSAGDSPTPEVEDKTPPGCSSPAANRRIIRINRAHMEEDTAKLKHTGNKTLIDFNRSGVPLIEIVSEADIETAAQAKEYLKELTRLIRWLDISDASMEKGTMRLEANVSVQEASKFRVQDSKVIPIGGYRLNPRVELKNINSFRFVEKAINYEIDRQKKVVTSGKKLQQETRGWDEDRGESFVQRVKEESDDYRYFPEPDIPPIQQSAFSSQLSAREKKEEMPWEAEERLEKEHKLSYQYISVLTRSCDTLAFFDQCTKESEGKLDPKLIARVIVNKDFDPSTDKAKAVVKQLQRRQEEVVSDEGAISGAVDRILSTNQNAVAAYKSGRESAINSLIGGVMRQLKGKGDATLVRKTLEEKLK